MLTEASAAAVLDGAPDYVLDCIDDVNTKADLLDAATSIGVRVLSVLGAGAKADPTRVLIADMADALKDPLAHKLRRELRYRADGQRHGARQGDGKSRDVQRNAIKVVYSSEMPCAELGELDPDQKADPNAFGSVAQMRIRTLPVLGPMPAIFGTCRIPNRSLVIVPCWRIPMKSGVNWEFAILWLQF
eukprot:m.161240 g.161240  ORF g.161240 m.161240 type:complete len:188 (+) comp14571_c0_seq2:669-1232(+)